MSELKSCPCCGGDAEYQSKYDGCQGWMVRCSRCHLEVWRGTDPGRCVEVWNRRAPGPEAARLLAAAKAARGLLAAFVEVTDHKYDRPEMALRILRAAIDACEEAEAK